MKIFLRNLTSVFSGIVLAIFMLNMVSQDKWGQYPTKQPKLAQIGTDASVTAITVGNSGSTLTNAGILVNNGNVGIGTTSPTGSLDVYGTTGANLQLGYFTDNSADDPQLRMANGKVARPSYGFISNIGTGMYYGGAGIIRFTTAGSDAVTIDNGNVGIGTTAPSGSSTEGTKALAIANGTEPVGGRADQSMFFTKDVSASSEMFTMDEDGNKTQLSAHDEAGNWVFYSYNDNTNKATYINMIDVIKELEVLSGKKLIYKDTTSIYKEVTENEAMFEYTKEIDDTLLTTKSFAVTTKNDTIYKKEIYFEYQYSEEKGDTVRVAKKRFTTEIDKINSKKVLNDNCIVKKKDGKYYRIEKKEIFIRKLKSGYFEEKGKYYRVKEKQDLVVK